MSRNINADLQVIKVEGWKREQLYDQTGLTWINRRHSSLTQCCSIPNRLQNQIKRGLRYRSAYSRFSPLDRPQAADFSNQAALPALFRPHALHYEAARIRRRNAAACTTTIGVSLPVGCPSVSRSSIRRSGDPRGYLRLLAHRATLEALERGDAAMRIVQSWRPDLDKFLEVRKGYLLYP